ncbi:MAG: EAL domain-containing protein [Sulfurimonas sp.]|nr:EAL domain-containing protein [Sulfurimonas sp.]
MKKNFNSLSTKIVVSIAAVSLFIILVIFSVFENINKKAFLNVEIEKANLIAKTIKPLIALNVYLDMQNKINQIAHQLIKNPNILSIKVLKNGEIINEVKSNEYKNGIKDAFIIKKDIYKPNSKINIGQLILVYSDKGYRELMEKYTKVMFILLFVLSVIFILFSLYVKKLLSPLRKIARLLKNYSPNQKIKFPFILKNNEIGLISNALNNMQEKNFQYSKKQQNINNLLEKKVNEKTMELRKQLYADTLTDMPNRLSLFNDIESADNGALLIINIDDFKEINDFFGHEIGDNVLKKISDRLKNMFSADKNIKLYRLSGDEFALFFIEKPSFDYFIKIAKKLVYYIEKMIFYHENNELGVIVSVGGTHQIQKALQKADIALKSAKKQQKSFFIYDEKLNIEEQYKENMDWVNKLKKAINQDKIIPYFQPIFNNKSGEITSYECLMRLIDDNDDVISPYKFLPIAKKSRLYDKLTEIMIEKSCSHFEHINHYFSINLSTEDIVNPSIVEYIKQKLKKYNVAEKIIFEILESEGIDSYKNVSYFINEMKELGCKIAIDDFGSGYSNFEHLIQLNVDYIKIDASLIKNLDTDSNAQIVVQTIVDFAKKLNILTVAEFVHNEEILIKVKELNIDSTQGFYLGEPLKCTIHHLD